MKYKKGDIVELLNIEINRGNEGYYSNQSGLIPVVGHRYHVESGQNEYSGCISLLGKGEYNGHPRTFTVYPSQIMIYKPKSELK